MYEARGRYGKTIVIDTVAGAKTARLEEVGAVKYKSYGVLRSINKKLLRRLVEQLVLEGYLIVGDYQVIKLGDISRLKNAETTVLVKITDDDKLPEKTSAVKKKSRGMESLTSAGFKLYDKLRALRLEIAREENMPPYIIFNDKTLIDMAVKVPGTQREMLDVSGVGENKYGKYGERFMAVVKECVELYPELLRDKEHMDQTTETGADLVTTKKKKTTKKQEFVLSPQEADQYHYKDYCTISEIRDEMNRICTRDDVKKLPATRLIEYLMQEELIREQPDSRFGKEATEKGVRLGIQTVEKVSEKGNAYTLLIYPPQVQKMLVEWGVRR